MLKKHYRRGYIDNIITLEEIGDPCLMVRIIADDEICWHSFDMKCAMIAPAHPHEVRNVLCGGNYYSKDMLDSITFMIPAMPSVTKILDPSVFKHRKTPLTITNKV